MNKRVLFTIFLFSIGVLIIYFFTSAGNTPFNHFTLLADSFLKGKFYIEGIYPWLEKVPLDANRWYVTNPPMPAILLLPFVYIFGITFPQQYLAHLLGAGITGLTMLLAYKIKKDLKLAIWSGLLIGLGSIVWYLSSVGSVWYLGQITSAFFITWALVEINGKSRPWLLGILLGSAFLSRSHMALTFPFIVFMNWNKFKDLKNLLKLMIVFSVFAGFGFIYNYLRFGNPFSNGYNLIPGVDTSPWFSQGLWNPVYLPKNLKILFLGLPKFIHDFPYVIPTWGGLSILLTTPAFLYSLLAPKRNWISIMSYLSILITLFIVCSHGGTGFAQFGYRFAVDFYPFLMYLTIVAVSKNDKLKWHHWFFVIFGIIVNLWGVIFINKLGFVGW